MREDEVERALGHAAAATDAQLLVRLTEVELGERVRAPEVVRRE